MEVEREGRYLVKKMDGSTKRTTPKENHMSKTVTTPNYPIVVGDVLTAGTEAYKIDAIIAGEVRIVDVSNEEEYFFVPLSIVQAIGTTDPKTGTPRV